MKVKSAFDFNVLESVVNADTFGGFDGYGQLYSEGPLDGESYIYADNGSDVLGVAHLDTVQDGTGTIQLRIKGERIIVCPRLDDRLGVYIITHMLPRLGIVCDWLLTTGEEIGRSSAELFKPDKTYKWAFSFDRAGEDTVLYQYDHKALRKVLTKHGFEIGHGSFSDLSFLNIGCSGVNFGCGYHDCHSKNAYALLSETFAQVARFRNFFHSWKNKVLPYSTYTTNEERRSAHWFYGSHNEAYETNSSYYRDTDARWPYCGYSTDKPTQLDWYEVDQCEAEFRLELEREREEQRAAELEALQDMGVSYDDITEVEADARGQ